MILTIKKLAKNNNVKLCALFLIVLISVIALIFNSFKTTYSRITDINNELGNLSRVDGNTVYVDNRLRDLYYYNSLNYTETGGTLPTGNDQNIYNNANMVQITITYSGIDTINNNLRGVVSTTEDYDTYVYYGWYPVKNGKVTIPLIDNPFTKRPTGKGFNSWISNDVGVRVYLDRDTYERFAEVTPTSNGSGYDALDLSFFAQWIDANEANTSDGWTAVFNTFETAGLHKLETTKEVCVTPELADIVMDGYYLRHTAKRYSYYDGYYVQYGYIYTANNRYCNSYGGCTYYTIINDGSHYTNGTTYYRRNDSNTNFTSVNTNYIREHATVCHDEYLYTSTDIMAGYYTPTSVARNDSIDGLYDSNGDLVSGTCNTNGGCNNYYEFLNKYDSNGNINYFDTNRTYYYYITRDLNIAHLNTTNLTSNWSGSKPFTFTGILENGTQSTNRWTPNGSVTLSGDVTIENMTINGNTGYSYSDLTNTRVITAAYHNLKIGRGIKKYNDNVNFNGVVGGNAGTGSSNNNNDTRYKIIVESGFYNNMSVTETTSREYYTDNLYIQAEMVYGNDLDRITNNNDNLEVYYEATASWAGNIRSSKEVAVTQTVKSGQFGTSKHDIYTGIYVGGVLNGNYYAARRVNVEGGWIYNLIGGPLTPSSRSNVNDTYIYMTGGNVDIIIGGAGVAASYGHRIISITGGNIKYSVLGGSNGNVNNASSTSATLNGSSFIYIGGNAVIGDDTLTGDDRELFDVEYGNVFGNGNGKSSSLGIGSNSNSYIIVTDNCTIKNGVYGGGNYAANGVNSSSSTAESKITILGGNINGNVYGGGNENKVEDYSKTNNVTINMSGGTVGGDIYGGSNVSGIITGSTNINVTGGTVTGNVYGGGKGSSTYVKQNSNVTIGELNTTGPTIGSVYGGSALGTVNAYSNPSSLSSYNTHVVVNSGTITNVFGGGQGDNSNTPYVSGNATTDIHGGTITNVFGGNDLKGTPNGTVTVNISGGTITNAYAGGNQTTVTEPYINISGGTITNAFGGGNNGAVTTSHMSITGGNTENAFGGGNKAGVTTTNVLIDGGTVTNAYGGSNASGDVTTSNVTIDSGNVTNAYGGNNIGGITATSYVTANGGTVGSVYGGGNNAAVNTSNVQVNNGIITNAFGGGNKAGVTTSNVQIDGGTVTNAFGGSNSSGTVNTSNVIINNGTVTNAFGGNNVGGTTGVTNVTVNGGTVSTVYGGGEKTSVTTSTNVTINSPVTSVFGGSDSAGTVEESIVNINTGGTATNVYGGNNLGGTTDVTNVTVNGTATNVYGGGEQTSVTDTANVDINGTVTNVFGGSDSAGTVEESIVNINTGGTATNVYGGNNLGGTTVTANVNINGEATTVYGGGLKAATGATYVTVNGTAGNVYGGGNEGNVTGSTSVIINGANINHNVYGGGNAANVLNNTNVTVTNSSIGDNVFGGGNNGMVIHNATTTITNGNVIGSAFAGGNGATAIVLGNNKINVEGTTTIGEHVFGGGNAAATGCESDIKNLSNVVIQACTNPNSSTSIVNIAGATIGGNVYGGANTSVVYGETFVNIGTNTVTDNLTKGNIAITGTVFGGGEANASGSEDYDFNFISVTEGINIHIDGSDHNTFDISGSIFGSGNASSSGGYSYIDIENYGTINNPKHNISIQRTDVVTLNNSSIALSGAQDRTNKYKSELFTLSRIGHLKLKNGSSLYLERGANLLEKYSSLVDVNGSEVKANVQIDDNTGNVTKNVDNRIYMFEGRNLNISDDESLGTFGIVDGMSFFGMYKIDRNGNIATGLYSNNYNNGDTVSGSELYYFSAGSYVVGKHKSAHDIYVDGFYSNFANEEGTGIDVKYIEPTPSDATYYRWVIGETVETLEVNITASKYATLGTQELQLMDYYHPNTEIYILGVNYDYLANDVNILPSEDIPRFATNVDDANKNFGLGMKTGTIGWITRGGTEFSTQSPDISGTTYYKAENSNAIPSFIFYLYHSKNITETRSLGTATISLMVVTPITDLSNKIQRINIEVNMNSAFFEGNNYEGTITPGAQYEMFANANVNITSKSTFSTYFSLYSSSATSIYQSGYTRNLVSNYAYPVNTKITMIDFASSGRPEYYYYIVDQAKYNSSVTDLANDNEVSYPLSNFIKMGSSSSTNTYDDNIANNNYYDSTLQKAEEEFIFIVDLKDTGLNVDVLDKTLLLELRDANNSTIIPVLDVAQQKLFYNLYGNKEANINTTATLSNSTLYIGQSVDLNVTTSFSQQTLGNITIIDTNFYEKKLGIKLSLYNSNNELVNGAGLLGTAFVYNGVRYYPRQDGTVRFNAAETVANVSSRITIDAEKSNISSGEYTLVIETFGSADGIYYGVDRTSRVEKPITVVNELYGLDANSSDDDVIVDKDTGLSQGGTNSLEYLIDYSSGLKKPSIRISLYRRTYSAVYDYSYSLVDIADYVSNELEETNEEKVYTIRSLPPARFQYTLYMNENLMTGTYQIRFSLYDDDNYVGHINKYIIIE